MTAKKHNTIPWHEEMVVRIEASLSRKREELNRIKNEAARMEAEIEYYKLQIEEAIKQKKDKFDRYNFLKKRSPTYGIH